MKAGFYSISGCLFLIVRNSTGKKRETEEKQDTPDNVYRDLNEKHAESGEKRA